MRVGEMEGRAQRAPSCKRSWDLILRRDKRRRREFRESRIER
jgi:hypothetical protein